MNHLRFLLACCMLIATAALPLSAAARLLPAVPPAARLITQPIDPARTIELAGNVRPEAQDAANDRGAAPDDMPLPDLLLQLKRPAARDAALAAFLDAQQDPASPDYHNWLTPAEFGQLYGPALEDVDAVAGWLQAQGFSITRIYDSGMTIAFAGTAGLVRKAFATEIHVLDVGGAPHYANVRNPRIPQALADAVHGIVALHDFKPHSNRREAAVPAYSPSNGTRPVVPADLATIYGLNPLFNAGIKGQGVTIALIEDTDIYALADISTFRSVFGLGTSTFTQAHPGCTDPGVVTGDDGEATLDVEWAAAAAPGATLELVSCANLFDAIANLVNANATPPAIMSISYGACEAELGASANSFINSTYQQAAAKGIAVFVASGDEGAAGCDNNATQATHGIGVNGLASTPYNVAVGGTDFGDTYAHTTSTYWNTTNTATYGSAKSYINEIPWNDSCASQLLASYAGYALTYGSTGYCNSGSGYLTDASGSGGPSGCASGSPSTSGVVGGTCAGRAKPSWQSGLIGNPGDHVRDLPDVALFAANGVWNHYYVFCFTDPNAGGKTCSGAPSGWAGAGGTSFSAPIMAGIQALVNQKNAIALGGNPNPSYYQLAAAEYGAGGSASCNSSNGNAVGAGCVFYDVTQGDMDVNCAGGSPNCYRPSGTNGVLSTSTGAYLPAFKTGTGWDFATGIGSVNAANLAANWPAPTKLKFTVEPVNGTVGVALATIKVSVENAAGNIVTGSSAAITLKFGTNPGAATLGGTLTTNAVNGVASFSNITVSKTGTGYTLIAGSGTLSTDTSTAFNIVAAGASQLAISTQPPSSVQSGASFGLAVAVKDALGNTVAGNTSAVTIALTSASGATLSGTKTLNAVNGVATFSGLSIDKTGSYTLTASDGTLTAATTNSVAVTAGAAARIVFSTQPPGSIIAAGAFGVAVTVQDAAGNTVTNNSSSVHVALTTANGATLSGTTTVNAVSGVATFSGLSVNKTGSYTLTATDGVLAPIASSAFAIVAGPAAKLVFTLQPASVVAGGATSATVAIEDAAGNVETGDDATQIVMKSNACNMATIATLTVSAGIAAFADLRFYGVTSSRQLLPATASLSVASTTFSVTSSADLVFAGEFDACVP